MLPGGEKLYLRGQNNRGVEYLNRIADSELQLRLEAFGAVQIRGPKWCGKTTTAERQAASVIKMQNPDTRDDGVKVVPIGCLKD